MTPQRELAFELAFLRVLTTQKRFAPMFRKSRELADSWHSMDTESLLHSLSAHEVRYVVISATAFPVHGYARATLDIFIDPTSTNAGHPL